nr:hypothetical protein [Rhodoferax sp.]
MTANRRNGVTIRFDALETIDAHQNKCGNDHQEHEEHHDLRVLANKFEHALTLHEKTKKANIRVRLCCGGGG